MAFNYPAQPWKDGQEIKITLGGEQVVIAKYNLSKNLWTHLRVNSEGEFFYVTACEVHIDRDRCPVDPCLNADFRWEDVETVQGALDWLYLNIFGEDIGIFDRIEALEAKDAEQQQQIDELIRLIGLIDGVDDLQEIQRLIQDLQIQINDTNERIDNLNAGQVLQGPDDGSPFKLTPFQRSALPLVVPGTQQETNHFLAEEIRAKVYINDFVEDQQRQDDAIANLSGNFSIRRAYTISRYTQEDGQVYVTSLTPSSATQFGFGDNDLLGRDTPTLSVGDTIRINNTANSNSNDFEVNEVKGGNRYGVTPLTNIGIWDDNDPCSVLFTGGTGDDSSLAGRVEEGEKKQQELIEGKVDKHGDTMTGALDFQLGAKTSPQFSISPNIAGTATNVFTTQGGQLRLRTSHTDNINDRVGSHIILDPNAGDPVTSIFNVRDPVNDRDATPRSYVDQTDEDLQGQIDDGIETQQELIADVETLQNKVTALEGSVIDANWSFEIDDRAPREGEFGLRVGGTTTPIWSAAEQIVISTTSLSGDTFTFDKVTVNDVIRIGAADGSSAEYKVLTIAAAGAYFVEHLRSSGFPSDEQEYSFSFLSAFDPEGLATIDYVDNQDETRVKKNGDTVQGALVFDTHNSILEVAGDTGSMRRRYVKVRGNNQFEILAYPGQDNNASKVAFKLESNTDGNPELTLNYIKDPTSNGHAVNKRWGDATYFPFTGGAITGNVTIENANFYVKDGSGNETFRVQPNGFCRTRDLYRAEREDGGPALQARIGSTLNAEIRCDGKATFKNDVTISNGGEFTVNKSSGSAIQIQQSGTDKATIWSDGTFETEKTSFSDKNLVTKKYVEDRLSETVGSPAVEVSTSSLPPAAKPRGHLLLTTTNNFYIYL